MRSLLCSFAVIGEEFVEAVHKIGADAVEDVAPAGERVDLESLACGDEAGEDGPISRFVSLLKNTPEPRRDREAKMRPTRHPGQT